MPNFNDSTHSSSIPTEARQGKTALRALRRQLKHCQGARDNMLSRRQAFNCGSREDNFLSAASLEGYLETSLRQPSLLEELIRQGGGQDELQELSLADRVHNLRKPQNFASLPALTIDDSIAQPARPVLTLDNHLQCDAATLRRLRLSFLAMGRSLDLHFREKANAVCIGSGWLDRKASFCTAQELLNTLLLEMSPRRTTVQAASVEDGLNALKSAAQEGSSLRLITTSSLMEQLAERMEQSRLTLTFPQTSRILLCYPSLLTCCQRSNVSQAPNSLELRSRCARLLGIPCSSVRMVMGLPGQPGPFISCAAGRFHLPAFLRFLLPSGPHDGGKAEAYQAYGLEWLDCRLPYPILRIDKQPGNLRIISFPKREKGCACSLKAPYIEWD